MKAFLGIAILPLICLGVIILTVGLVIIILRRRTQSVSQQLREKMDVTENGSPANTRWARGDLKSTPKSRKIKGAMEPCPACGGENRAGSSTCAFCGNTL